MEELDAEGPAAAYRLLSPERFPATAPKPQVVGPRTGVRAGRIQAPDGSGERIAILSTAGDLGEMLRVATEIFPVMAVPESNYYHMILRGKPDAVEGALAMLAHLRGTDVVREPAIVFTMRLTTANAPHVAAVVNEMFEKDFFPGRRPMIAVGDARTNMVVVCIDGVYESYVRSFIGELDRPPESATKTATEIRIEGRTLPPATRP